MENGMLAGKTGLVFGVANRRSIAWAIAQAWAAQGARLIFSYAGDRIRATPNDLARIRCVASSYAGHLQHANSHRLRAAIRRRFPWLRTAAAPRRFHHRLASRRITLRIRTA